MRIKALLATFTANFDDLVRKIENHEAVADCVIQDVRESAAKIRSQLNVTHARIDKQQHKERQLEDDCQRWRERALACREADEDKALRCMQSLKNTQHTLENLHHQIAENQTLAADLQAHLDSVEQKLTEIQGKRESLSARSTRNKVESSALRNLHVDTNDGIFERWETQVIADEYRNVGWSSTTSTPADGLDREFRKQEDRSALLAELKTLDKVITDKNTGGARHENT